MKIIPIFVLFCICAFTVNAQLTEKTGIGVRLRTDSTLGYKIPLVISVIPNSPSQEAGLQEGDIILKVDDRTTKDVLLADVVGMIVGEEGTMVKLEIERKGSVRNYTIPRKKYQYAEGYYTSDVKGNDFCDALVRLMNDAGYDFANTMDTNEYVDEEGAWARRFYESKVAVPGAAKTSMASSFGVTCMIEFGPFTSTDAVNEAGENIYAQLQTCFPKYYYESVAGPGESNIIQIGKSFPDGYESAIMEIHPLLNEKEQNYKLILRINGGKPTRYYQVATPRQENSFADALNTIYDDILNNYNNVKGTKHEIPGSGPFSSSTWWYEIEPLPEGAHDCGISEGGLSMTNGCRCRYYLGESYEEAVQTFNKLYEVMRDALGSEYVHTFERPDLDMTIPEKAEGVIIFGKKKKRSYESLPLLALVIYKDTEGKYAVNMLFHKFGF